MIWNWLRRQPFVVDLNLVLLIGVVTLAVAGHHSHVVAAIGLGGVQTVALFWRRTRPVLVLAAVCVLAVVMAAVGVWIVMVPLQIAAALYTVAATTPRRVAFVSGATTLIVTTLVFAISREIDFGGIVSRSVFLVAAWLLGDSIGSRRAYVREIEEKAERLEREQESESRRVVAEEQARIARELHDVVAHALSVIVVQAGAANDVFEVDPRRVREPMRAIESAARSALGDLRRVLGLLREGVEYAPQPGLDQLDELLARVRATGLDVVREVEGPERPLPGAVDLSAYRIVQEALTNTLKHAGAAHAFVHVRYGDELGLEIRDDGRGPNGDHAGAGLIGMRERVAMLGGVMETGPAAEGGFVVSASIPIPATE